MKCSHSLTHSSHIYPTECTFLLSTYLTRLTRFPLRYICLCLPLLVSDPSCCLHALRSWISSIGCLTLSPSLHTINGTLMTFWRKCGTTSTSSECKFGCCQSLPSDLPPITLVTPNQRVSSQTIQLQSSFSMAIAQWKIYVTICIRAS